MKDWLVLQMDEGVLHRTRTRKAAVEWLLNYSGGRVLRRRQYGPGGAYEYEIGYDHEDYSSYFIEREDVAREEGWGHYIDREARTSEVHLPIL